MKNVDLRVVSVRRGWFYRIAATFIVLPGTLAAAPSTAPSSYTPEQLRTYAGAYILLADRPAAASVSAQVVAGEFRGIVLGYLDGALSGESPDETLDRCVRQHAVNEIVYRTGSLVLDAPLRRDVPARFTLGLSVLVACDDSKWRK